VLSAVTSNPAVLPGGVDGQAVARCDVPARHDAADTVLLDLGRVLHEPEQRQGRRRHRAGRQLFVGEPSAFMTGVVR
jgi:hypothetical protein